MDALGRIVVPKPLRDALGLMPGTPVDISLHGAGLVVLPAGRTSRPVEDDGVPLVTGATRIDDDTVTGLLDAGRR